MKFNYEEYFRGAFLIPLLAFLLFLYLLIPQIKEIISLITHRERLSKKWAICIFFSIATVFLLCVQVGRLAHGGLHLVYEKSSASLTVRGEIQKVEHIGRMSFPELGSKYGNTQSAGVKITINGIVCTAPSTGSFEVGDVVDVEYLPRSGYVLSISAAAE